MCQICYRTGSTMAVKRGRLSDNTDTFMPIFSAQFFSSNKSKIRIGNSVCEKCPISYLNFKVNSI